MRLIITLVLLFSCTTVLANDNSVEELEQVQATLAQARKAAAEDPTIRDASSPPVVAYLAEQKRRRLLSIRSLRERIDKAQGDESQQELLAVWRKQLADLENRPLEPVHFDNAYKYPPVTGLVGYSKRVRLFETMPDGKSLIEVANAPVLLEGLDTSDYPSGKFLYVDEAILVGPQAPDQMVRGVMRKTYTATLVDLEAVLKKAGISQTAEYGPIHSK